MAQKIGDQDGVKAMFNRLRDLDPAGTALKKSSGAWPEISTLPPDLSKWKAYDKAQRSMQVLVDDHDAASGGQPVPPTNGGTGADLSTVRARIFLAHEVLVRGKRVRVEVDPLAALQAPPWMVPVCTADPGYRQFYPPSTIDALRSHFGKVEAWCDCRPQGGTPYSTAVAMVEELGLDGPAWGQCETRAEFDHAYESGARRLVGKCSDEVLDDARLALVASGEVLLSAELYRNCMPWVVPDWRNANAGIGGNCIACYADATPCYYTPVQAYKDAGYYAAHYDSVYGVGLSPADWAALA